MMKNRLFFLMLVLLPIFFITCTEPGKEAAAPETFLPLHRGTNIAHWLSQSNRRGEERSTFFTLADVQQIAGMGFDHIRLPIDEEQMWTETGEKEAEAFALMHQCIKWCQDAGLKVIIDLHILRSHHFNEAEKPLWTQPAAQQKFIQFWVDLSQELSQYPDGLVAYEPMNEPVADYHEEWNLLVGRVIAAIRELEPNRLLVIGSNRWQSVSTFDSLRVPPNDTNILLSFHLYEPFLLTHYGASWTNLRHYRGPVHYPGALLTPEEWKAQPDSMQPLLERYLDTFNLAKLESFLAKPLAKARETGLSLYCGEWGTVSNAPKEDRLRWYRDMIALFEKHQIGTTNWNYKSDNFGLVNGDGSRNEDLIEIMRPAKVN